VSKLVGGALSTVRSCGEGVLWTGIAPGHGNGRWRGLRIHERRAVLSPGVDVNNNILLEIVEDTIDEPDETVVVELWGSANASLGANTHHTYTIVDNDPAALQIEPCDPELSSGEYVHFTTSTGVDGEWSLSSNQSGGTIDIDSGLYQAVVTPGEDGVESGSPELSAFEPAIMLGGDPSRAQIWGRRIARSKAKARRN